MISDVSYMEIVWLAIYHKHKFDFVKLKFSKFLGGVRNRTQVTKTLVAQK